MHQSSHSKMCLKIACIPNSICLLFIVQIIHNFVILLTEQTYSHAFIIEMLLLCLNLLLTKTSCIIVICCIIPPMPNVKHVQIHGTINSKYMCTGDTNAVAKTIVTPNEMQHTTTLDHKIANTLVAGKSRDGPI